MIYWMLFWTFLKVGLFTIGGGYAMIPLIQQQLIDRHGWITPEQFTDFVGIAESTPGPFAINIATFAGIHVGEQHGLSPILASVCSTGGVVLPSLIIILLIAGAFHYAMRHWAAAGFAVALFLLTQWVKIGAVALILLGGALGLVLQCFGISL